MKKQNTQEQIADLVSNFKEFETSRILGINSPEYLTIQEFSLNEFEQLQKECAKEKIIVGIIN